MLATIPSGMAGPRRGRQEGTGGANDLDPLQVTERLICVVTPLRTLAARVPKMTKAIDVLSTSVAQSLRLLVHSFLENSGFKLHATKERSRFALPNQTTRTRGVVDTRWCMHSYPSFRQGRSVG